MSETITWLLAGLAGGVLGVFFFGGLWWTVQKMVDSNRSVLWMIASFLVRMSGTVAGIYFVGGGHWQRIVACLVGFLIARLVITQLTKTEVAEPEVPHAS